MKPYGRPAGLLIRYNGTICARSPLKSRSNHWRELPWSAAQGTMDTPLKEINFPLHCRLVDSERQVFRICGELGSPWPAAGTSRPRAVNPISRKQPFVEVFAADGPIGVRLMEVLHVTGAALRSFTCS